ncbi:MAG: MoxR family ATPase [Oscillospiraceae bacterium]|nr:MoxR family ATPase [Oscillospiraceae bacterium]
MQKDMVTTLKNIVDNVERVIIGKREAIEFALCSFMCRGHVLIEDMPGVGKTSLVAAIAKSFDCSFRRIQFTPDILPSDITGFSMYNQKTGEFEYKQGAIMSQIILADEINRTSPKTQSSLLEVMEENQVTVDGQTYQVPQPFIVFATQNPIEYLGTYPLPEAQLDRFFMRISMGYPTADEESKMLDRFKVDNPLRTLQAVSNAEELVKIQESVANIHIDKSINDYVVSIVRETRDHPNISLGGSPRATICLFRAAQAWALYNERDYVLPDDVAKMAVPVIEHRLVLRQEARFKKITAPEVVQSIVSQIKVPLLD